MIFSHHFSGPQTRPSLFLYSVHLPAHSFSSSFTTVWSFARRRHCHPLRPRCRRLPPPPRHRRQRPQVRLLSLPPSPTWQAREHSSPLQRPRRDIVFGMQVHFSPLTFVHSFTESNFQRTTHPSAGSCGYVVPEAIRNTGRGVLAHQYDCFPTHTQAQYSLSTQPSSPTFSSAAIPLFVPTLPRKTPTSKFQSPYWNPFPIKPSPSSYVSPSSIHSIVSPPKRFDAIVGLPLSPPPTRHPTALILEHYCHGLLRTIW